MSRIDPWELDIMHDCQRGDPLAGGGFTGSVCRNKNACMSERRCYFVHGVERYLERHGAMPTSLSRIVWHPGFDIPTIPWAAGYDTPPPGQLSLFEAA